MGDGIVAASAFPDAAVGAHNESSLTPRVLHGFGCLRKCLQRESSEKPPLAQVLAGVAYGRRRKEGGEEKCGARKGRGQREGPCVGPGPFLPAGRVHGPPMTATRSPFLRLRPAGPTARDDCSAAQGQPWRAQRASSALCGRSALRTRQRTTGVGFKSLAPVSRRATTSTSRVEASTSSSGRSSAS